MATNVNPTELKYLLECGICLNRFEDPRVLPCLHSYCLECLKSHISSNKDSDGAFKCPQCRERCILPEGGADNFPKNFFVNTMKDVIPASFLKEPNSDEASSSAVVMCKQHSDESASQHGTAVVFCVQCEANFCEICFTNHGQFDFMKNHKLIPLGDNKSDEGMKQSPNCELHQELKINWYCRTCSVPACSDCIIEKHHSHTTDKLSIVETELKADLLDVSKMAAKRIEFLQETLADIKSKRMKMEEELDEASKDISDTADAICRLVRQHEATLQDKLKEARNMAIKHFEQTMEEIKAAKDNASGVMSCADTLHQASSEQALCTVLQAPINKQQFLHQQEIPLPSVLWKLNRRTAQPSQLSSSSFIGNVDIKTVFKSKKVFQTEDIILEAPVQSTKLEYSGTKAVSGIVSIHLSTICVAHYEDQFIWIYSDVSQLKPKIEIAGIEQISGMIAIDGNSGKLAIVDNKQCRVHFVTLSKDVEILQHLTMEIPILPFRISINSQRELVANSSGEKQVAILNPDGQALSAIELSIPPGNVKLQCVVQTKSGFVVCDDKNKKVYFPGASGEILHTYTYCQSPWFAMQTSSGHVLIADCLGNKIVVFSEGGEYLGNIHDTSGSIRYPNYIHVDEGKRRMYVGCGGPGTFEVRAYKFALSDFQQLPVTRADIAIVRVGISLIDL